MCPCSGLGVGFKTYIYCASFVDIVENILVLLNDYEKINQLQVVLHVCISYGTDDRS